MDIDSPWVVLGEMAARLLDAKHKADRGDNEALRAFVNTALAKTWREEAETANPEPLFGRHIYAIKGMDGARLIWPRRAGKSRKLPGSNVWTIGVDTAKDAIYSKLKVTTPGPGYCHFPIAYQQEFFHQLTSEEVRTRFVRGHPVRYWFKPSGKRNEALDRRVYALAALYGSRAGLNRIDAP